MCHLGIQLSVSEKRFRLDTEISAPDPDQLKARIIPKASTRKGLPITFEMGGSQATVMSSPDSGSEENAISQELALKLGLKIEKYEERAFRMANGKVVRCCGRTISACGFGTESHLGYLSLLCRFYVFKTLASPLIMCMGFPFTATVASSPGHWKAKEKAFMLVRWSRSSGYC
ncbi:hypothetical protein AOQ84DRAFT_357989 [Glonium stellatum]|uniref:Uncharacterized protein n=1 Tax=Glonium stellatum TaxID=574774 RepID=A0A8E2EMG1_9PEZI|nr:hypothetical protein AOQ84DRAFT_357989 [Glonium stellatum]